LRKDLIVLLVGAFIVSLTVIVPRAPQSIAPQVTQVRGAVVHVAKVGSCESSGCLISSDGILFTARHVTGGDPCGTYVVTLDSGAQYPVKYVLEDREADLSYMKLDLPKGVTTPWVVLAPADSLRVGDPVIIAGSPLGRQNINTFSLGIVSALDRDLDYKWHAMIQTTGPAYPGNSGGAIFNMEGRVVGVLVAGQGDCLNFGVPVIFLRESVKAVRQWFVLCRIRPLQPDMRGPRGPTGSQGGQITEPNDGQGIDS